MQITRPLVLLFASHLVACDLDVVDKDQALLLKPELLSMVVEPPVAAPGAPVRASYLLAGPEGPLQSLRQLWVPADLTQLDPAGRGVSSEWMESLLSGLPRYGLSLEDLAGEALALEVPEDTGAGQAALPISVLVQIKPLCAGFDDHPAVLLEALPANLACGAVRVGLRRVAVSGQPAGANPRLQRLLLLDGAGAHPLVVVGSDDQDLASARRLAREGALVVEELSTVRLRVAAEDATAGLQVQWISTGGDFGGTRLLEQPWVVPAYRPPQAGALDPNRYPVWLILRNSSGGQSWAELYLSVRPRP